MVKVTRKRHTAEFKARVALEAIRGEQALAEIGAKHGVHLTMAAAWKKAAVEGMTATFSPKAATPVAAGEAELVWSGSANCSGSAVRASTMRL